MTARTPRFPLRSEHKILLGGAILSIVLAVALPFASAPGKTLSVETLTTTRLESYLSTSTRYETRTATTTQTYRYLTTSFYTRTYTVTYYITTTVYSPITGFYGMVTIGTIVVIPVQVRHTQIQTVVMERTTRIEGRQTWTYTGYSAFPKVSTTVESIRSTQTLPFSLALARSLSDNVALVAAGVLLPIVAYHRINAYRTRLHIYYEILSYTAYSSRLPSHIMRACNLETSKFGKYIEALKEKGFVDEIRQDGGRGYRASSKGLGVVRNLEFRRFIEELP